MGEGLSINHSPLETAHTPEKANVDINSIFDQQANAKQANAKAGKFWMEQAGEQLVGKVRRKLLLSALLDIGRSENNRKFTPKNWTHPLMKLLWCLFTVLGVGKRIKLTCTHIHPPVCQWSEGGWGHHSSHMVLSQKGQRKLTHSPQQAVNIPFNLWY